MTTSLPIGNYGSAALKDMTNMELIEERELRLDETEITNTWLAFKFIDALRFELRDKETLMNENDLKELTLLAEHHATSLYYEALDMIHKGRPKIWILLYIKRKIKKNLSSSLLNQYRYLIAEEIYKGALKKRYKAETFEYNGRRRY